MLLFPKEEMYAPAHLSRSGDSDFADSDGFRDLGYDIMPVKTERPGGTDFIKPGNNKERCHG